MFCPKCGAQLDDAARFCGKCGNPVEGGNAAGVSGVPVSGGVQPSANNVSYVGAPAAQTAVSGGAAVAPAVRKKSKPARIIIPIVIVVIVALAAFVAWKAFFEPYNIDADTFPDSSVRAVLSEVADTDKDGKISRDEAKAVTVLAIDNASDITGLGKFGNLTELTLTGDSLKSLDTSEVSSLEKLDTSGCSQLTDLNVSSNFDLREIHADTCPLSNLDLSKNKNIEIVEAEDTNISDLDISNNDKLTTVKVNNDVKVSGIEDSNLNEYWVVDSYTWKYPSAATINTFLESAKCYYDANNRITKIVKESGTTSLIQVTDTWEYSYNDEGLCDAIVVTSDYSSGGSSLVVNWTIEYDDLGRLTSAKSDYGDKYTCTYAEGSTSAAPIEALLGVGQGGGLTVYYTYDDSGRLTEFSQYTGSDIVTTYSLKYDEDGNITSCDSVVSDSYKSTYITADRNSNEDLQKVTYKYGLTSGWTQEYSYKDDGSLFSVEKNITEGSSGQANQAAGIEYDENGNIANVSVVYKYTAGGQDKGSVEYTYKRILTTEDAGSIDQAIYAYDILKPSCQTLFWNPAKVQNDLNTSVIYGGLPEVFQHGEGTGEDLLQEELNKAS